jgi:hypothetical protein
VQLLCTLGLALFVLRGQPGSGLLP